MGGRGGARERNGERVSKEGKGKMRNWGEKERKKALMTEYEKREPLLRCASSGPVLSFH